MYGIYDVEAHRVTVSNGGTIRRSSGGRGGDGGVFHASGMALGLTERASFENSIKEIDRAFAGDKLFLYTDGVTRRSGADVRRGAADGRLLETRPRREVARRHGDERHRPFRGPRAAFRRHHDASDRPARRILSTSLRPERFVPRYWLLVTRSARRTGSGSLGLRANTVSCLPRPYGDRPPIVAATKHESRASARKPRSCRSRSSRGTSNP